MSTLYEFHSSQDSSHKHTPLFLYLIFEGDDSIRGKRMEQQKKASCFHTCVMMGAGGGGAMAPPSVGSRPYKETPWWC